MKLLGLGHERVMNPDTACDVLATRRYATLFQDRLIAYLSIGPKQVWAHLTLRGNYQSGSVV